MKGLVYNGNLVWILYILASVIFALAFCQEYPLMILNMTSSALVMFFCHICNLVLYFHNPICCNLRTKLSCTKNRNYLVYIEELYRHIQEEE